MPPTTTTSLSAPSSSSSSSRSYSHPQQQQQQQEQQVHHPRPVVHSSPLVVQQQQQQSQSSGGGGGGCVPHGAGESHRVYWQQWLQSSSSTTYQSTTGSCSNREWITSSVAVRMTREARAIDVTNLLRKSLGLLSSQTNNDEDALVLVGTLYSLPNDYVQFEDLQQQVLDRTNSLNSTRSGDPFHLVHTLDPFESPLVVRDRMTSRIRTLEKVTDQRAATTTTTTAGPTTRRNIMAPQLQFFFIPASLSSNNKTTIQNTTTNETDSASSLSNSNNNNYSNIPNCLQLEGYSTSMEEEDDSDKLDVEDDDDDEDDYGDMDKGTLSNNPSMNNDNGTVQEIMETRFPWLIHPETSGEPKTADTQVDDNNKTHDDQNPTQKNLDRQKVEQKRALQMVEDCYPLLQPPPQQQASNSQLLSGFLLKQTNRDRHVWRKVFCVLTHDFLWFLTRLYKKNQEDLYCHRGRLRLTKALVLESNVRTPHAFELVTPHGQVHVFRAECPHKKDMWIQILRARIVQSFENSFSQRVQWLLNEEGLARGRRIQAVLAVENLIPKNNNKNHPEDDDGKEEGVGYQHPFGIRVNCLLRWGLQVADYRELSRYVHSILPPKSPVVVVTTSNVRNVRIDHDASLENVQKLIESCWMQAKQLLAVFKAGPPDNNFFKYPRRIQTLFCHIEYIITGRFGKNGAENDRPPPLDLFDRLWQELQSLVANE